MRESISLLVVLGVVATGICIPGVAQALEEMVFQFRSQEIGDTVPDAVCERGAAFLGLPAEEDLPDGTNLVMLDAELYSNRTRAKDGKVVNSEVRVVGTAQACAWVDSAALFGNLPPFVPDPYPIDPTQPLPKAPFYGEFEIGDLFLPSGGECLMTSNTVPVPWLGLVGCSMLIPGDENQGLLGGNATSNSVFNPLYLPDFHTGSYWTVHIYTE